MEKNKISVVCWVIAFMLYSFALVLVTSQVRTTPREHAPQFECQIYMHNGRTFTLDSDTPFSVDVKDDILTVSCVDGSFISYDKSDVKWLFMGGEE